MIDTSLIKDMNELFAYLNFNGDISKWNVYGVEDMKFVFSYSDFNGDISKWNISNVEDIHGMFEKSKNPKKSKSCCFVEVVGI